MVGRDAVIRVSSVISPLSFRGTLKSTRTSTFLPATSKSRTVFYPRIRISFITDLFSNISSQVNYAVGITPFIVVPAYNLSHTRANHHGGQAVDDGAQRAAVVITGYQRFVAVAHNTFEFAFSSFLKHCIDFFGSGVFCSRTVRSVMETFGVGTRIAKPFSLPFSSGRTRATAFAAPVVVGMMEQAAARARRRSLCGRSRILWSLV